MTTARPAHMPYRYDFEVFKLCHMLSTYVLHYLMQNYVCALELWVSVETFVITIEFKLKIIVMRFKIM